MQERFCCIRPAFRLALQTTHDNWASVSEIIFLNSKDFRNGWGGEESHPLPITGGSTQAAGIDVHLSPRGHGDGKTKSQLGVWPKPSLFLHAASAPGLSPSRQPMSDMGFSAHCLHARTLHSEPTLSGDAGHTMEW